MDLPLDENQGRLSYWLFYAQRCVAYAYAEVLRAHCEERGKPYVITPPHNREDRRVVKIYLTDEGRDISNTLVSSVEHFEQRIKRGFSESEMDRFLGQLQQLIVNAAEIGPGLGDRFGLLPKDMG